jgi:hypothetical protein
VNAAFSLSRISDIVDDITAANIIIAVVKGGEFSACCGFKTVSIAKKVPATGALKPTILNKFCNFAYIQNNIYVFIAVIGIEKFNIYMHVVNTSCVLTAKKIQLNLQT